MKIPILDLNPEINELWEPLNAAMQRVLRENHFINGPDVEAFEHEVAKYLGVRHAVGLNSGTDALTIALRALDIGPGDEIITTSFTFFATAEAALQVGAKAVFVDIDPLTFNIDPKAIKAKINENTRAIIPVHLYGRPAPMDEIMAIAKAHNLKVVEDVAQAFGAEISGKKVGTIGDIGAYSFFPSKNLGCFGDGGLLTTDDDALAAAARMLRTHGAKKKYYNETMGYNSRLDTIQAAILRVKLPHIDKNNAGRLRVAKAYNEYLAGVEGLVTPSIPEKGSHVFHQYTVRVKERDRLQRQLGEAHIQTMVYYPVPVHKLPIYEKEGWHLPEAERASAEALSLPIWPTMDLDTIQKVVNAVKQSLVLQQSQGVRKPEQVY